MKKESALNLIFNILSLIISMGLSFWITPFIINTLGAESYGFVPLSQQLVNYMTVLTVSVTAVSGRFYTVAKQRGDYSLQQDYFSSALISAVSGSIILTIPLVIAFVNIDKLLNIPTYLVSDVQLSFLLYGGIFLMVFFTSIFNMGAFSINKLYLISGVNIINIVIKTIVIVFLLISFTPKIWYVSLGTFVATFFALIITIAVFKGIEPGIKIFRINLSKVKEILSSGCWASLSEIGVILFLQIDLLVANLNLGAKAAGEYAVVLQLPTILRTFSGAIISIFVPVVITYYAADKIEEMIKYVNNAVNYTGIVLSLPIGIITGLGGTVLSTWINPDFKKYSVILAVLTFHLSINLSVQTIASIQTAVNKLKIPAFATLFMGTINFCLAYLLSGYFKMGAMGIALAGSILLTAKNLIFSPLYIAKITNQKWNTYLKGVIKPLFSTLFVAMLSYLSTVIYTINSFRELIVVCFIISCIYLIFVYVFIPDKYEKQAIIKKVGGYFGKS